MAHKIIYFQSNIGKNAHAPVKEYIDSFLQQAETEERKGMRKKQTNAVT